MDLLVVRGIDGTFGADDIDGSRGVCSSWRLVTALLIGGVVGSGTGKVFGGASGVIGAVRQCKKWEIVM